MELIPTLKNLGLNEKEARVYASLLQTGGATAYVVAKHSGLKKPTTYVILDGLIEKGFVNKAPQAKVTHYTAVDPDHLFSAAENKLRRAREALPELRALSRGGEHKVRVTYYEGLDGIKEMYNKIFKDTQNKEVVGFYAHGRNAPAGLVEYWDEWTRKRLELNIKVRGVTTKDDSTKKWVRSQKQYLLNLIALSPEEYDSDVSIEVYSNFTQIVSSKYLQGVLIDNPDVAKTIKQVFEICWGKIGNSP